MQKAHRWPIDVHSSFRVQRQFGLLLLFSPCVDQLLVTLNYCWRCLGDLLTHRLDKLIFTILYRALLESVQSLVEPFLREQHIGSENYRRHLERRRPLTFIVCLLYLMASGMASKRASSKQSSSMAILPTVSQGWMRCFGKIFFWDQSAESTAMSKQTWRTWTSNGSLTFV